MKYLLFVLPLTLLVACGGDDAEAKDAKPLVLKTDQEKLSYVLGAKQASDIVNPNDPNSKKYKLDLIAKGFKSGFAPGFVNDPSNPCITTVQNLFGGGNGAVLDENYLDEGCRCMGELTAGMMYMQLNELGQAERINKAMLIRGFEDGLKKADTVLTVAEKEKVLVDFNQEMQQLVMAQQQEQASKFDAVWAEIKAKPGIRELENGIYIETLKAGTGPSPKEGQDIQASYILSDFAGNVIQDSRQVTPEGKFEANLNNGGPNGVIQGWVIGFQSVKKGGRYKLYIPKEMAYGDAPLQFEVELFQIGPAGSLKK